MRYGRDSAFLRFNATDRAEREAAFRELCETIGADLDTDITDPVRPKTG